MKPVVNYLENLTKSMSYAAIDVSKEIMPNVGDFLDSNSGFLKATYATLRNPKMALRKSVTAIQESKIYQAVEYGAKNAFEDNAIGVEIEAAAAPIALRTERLVKSLIMISFCGT